MKKILYILIMLFSICCNRSSPQELWDNAKSLRAKGDLRETIINLENIISNHPQHGLAADAQYQIAEIYLNDIKNYDIAIEKYQKVIENHSSYDVAKNSLFMIGYVYNNFLTSYTDAINSYRLFLKKYPHDELVPSVEYELNGLFKIEQTIDSLNSLVREKESF